MFESPTPNYYSRGAHYLFAAMSEGLQKILEEGCNVSVIPIRVWSAAQELFEIAAEEINLDKPSKADPVTRAEAYSIVVRNLPNYKSRTEYQNQINNLLSLLDELKAMKTVSSKEVKCYSPLKSFFGKAA
jgi:hypothetical protein